MVELKMSKPVDKIKKGDKIKVEGHELVVDEHYVFIEHKDTTEMIIELFNPKNDKEYQIRYFSDQVETSIEFYFLQGEFQYTRVDVKKIEW